METTPVIAEYKFIEGNRLDGDTRWQVIVFQTGYTDKGTAYKQVVEVMEHAYCARLEFLLDQKYGPRLVRELDMTPIQRSLF